MAWPNSSKGKGWDILPRFYYIIIKERFHTLSPLCKRGYLINLLMTDILSCVVRKQLRTQESILIVKSL